MENTEFVGKKTRKRSKSEALASVESQLQADQESAPDLNGEGTDAGDDKPKDLNESHGVFEDNEPMDTSTLQDILEDNPRGRKRKVSEVKEDESIQDKEAKDLSSAESGNKSDSKDELSASESSADSKDIKLPPKQTLGKGKRARIPNKRYGDILLSEKHPKSRTSLANGETQNLTDTSPSKENIHTENVSSNQENKDDNADVLKSPAVASIKGTRTSQTGSPSTPASKKPKLAVDMSNPNFLKPFHYGWKRELVYRATSDSTSKRNGDIYYYTPSGKKVRSMREVSENLKNKELTLDDFTFFKEPIGIDDPEKEIIRDAKYKAVGLPKKSSPKTPKMASPKANVGSGTPVDSTPTTPTNAKSAKGAGFKIRLSGRAKDKKAEKKSETNMDIANWSPPAKKSMSKWSGTSLNSMDNKPCRPCSIRCEGVSGLIPTLQCRLCLCLYHYECVGLTPHTSIQGYVCKNCQLDQDMNTGSSPAPPPLTPINTLKSMTAQSSVLPKLQRIPKPGDKFSSTKVKSDISKTELPHLTPCPGILTTVPKLPKNSDSSSNSQTENKSIVGGVTTWFPPSSTIQLGSDQAKTAELGPVQAVRPQFVEFLGDRKFIIIPKHNFLSVSPTIAATASARSEDNVNTPEITNLEGANDKNEINRPDEPDSAKLDNESVDRQQKDCDIKAEPEPLQKEDKVDECVKTVEQQTVEISTVSLPPESAPSVTAESQVVDKQQIDPIEQVQQDTAGTPDEQESPNVSTPAKRKSARASGLMSVDKTPENKFADYFLQNVAYGYKSLLYIFQYLKVQDLLRAGCVCTMWKDIASHPILWKTVRMKNSQVHSFEGLANTLEKHGTVHLDLRKMLLPNGGDEIWPSFSQAIKKVESLRKIELCRCPAVVVEQLATSNPQLEVINAVTIKCENMSLSPFASLRNLQELRLKSTAGLSLTSDLTALKELVLLKHLSLTSVKDLNKLNIDVIADLRNLESLELGECTDFPKTFGPDILVNLHKLEKLRLEKGQGNCYTFEILDAVRNMPNLEQLELVNFDIKAGFDKALGVCTNIKKLLIIPTYISQSATTNHMVLGGVLRLQSTLSHFVWGVTLELLRVTELFVDQCEEPEKKEKKEKKSAGNGDSIPVLKPVPLLSENVNEIPPAHEPPQVEILPLPNLQKLLLQSLPTTRVKILKIPFHATWRQSITDTVN